MKRLAFLVLLALTLSAAGRFGRTNQRCAGGRSDRGLACEDGAYFEFAPASGAGLPSQSTLCSAAAPYLAGQYWCLDDNGQPASAPIQLTTNGSPVVTTPVVMPGGLDGQVRVGRRSSAAGVGYGESANVNRADAGVAFTACTEVIPGMAEAAEIEVMGLGTNGSGGNFKFIAYTGANAFKVINSTSPNCAVKTTLAGTKVVSNGAHHLLCVNWNEGGDLKWRTYVDGAIDVTSGAVAVGICEGAAAARHNLLGYQNGASQNSNPDLKGVTLGGFYTEQALTASQIAAIARAVLADTPTGAKGEAMTFSRASTRGCPKSDNSAVTILPNNRPCITNGGILVESARTNSALRSQELNTVGVWNPNGLPTAPTVTVDAATAPDGTLTAERVQYPAVTAPAQYARMINTGFTSAGGTGTCSVYVKGNGVSGSFPMYLGTSFPAQTSTCTFVDGSWSRCALTGTFTAAGENFYIGPSGVGTATTPAQDVFIWGAQCEAGAYATSYIPTAGAAAARAADVSEFAASSSGWAGFSLAGTLVSSGVTGATNPAPIAAMSTGAMRTAPYLWPYVAANDGRIALDGTGSMTVGLGAGAIALTPVGTSRIVAYHTGTDVGQCAPIASTCATAASVWSSPSWTKMRLGSAASGTIDGVIKQVCLDPAPARCR